MNEGEPSEPFSFCEMPCDMVKNPGSGDRQGMKRVTSNIRQLSSLLSGTSYASQVHGYYHCYYWTRYTSDKLPNHRHNFPSPRGDSEESCFLQRPEELEVTKLGRDY